jgi:hypothetical protein
MDHEALLNAPAEDQARVIQEMCEVEGPEALVNWIQTAPGDETRRKLYGQAFVHLDQRNWLNPNLDAQVSVARAGIAEYLRQSELHRDDLEQSRKLKDSANILSYNLSANLADCWPDDPLPREQRHFVEGFAAADNCVHWREQLGKGPRSLSMAYWAKGIHLLALSDIPGAVESWQQAYEQAQRAALEAGKSAQADADGDFNVILGLGYCGIGKLLSGEQGGQEDFDNALEAFNQQLQCNDEETREEAVIGLGQLRKVYQKYVLGIQADAGA